MARPRWFSAYRPDLCGPVIKLTCQFLLTNPVADFCTLGFAPSIIVPRWPHPRVRPRWLSANSPDSWGPVIKQTCQIPLTHPMADFCTLSFEASPFGPRWPHPRARPRWFSAYRPDPWGPLIKLTCQILLTHPVQIPAPLVSSHRPYYQDGHTKGCGRDGSRPIDLTPVSQ